MGDFCRHEAVDPSFWSRGVGENSGPVAVTRVDVDDGGAGIDSCEPDQPGLPGLVVHRDLRCGRESWVRMASARPIRTPSARLAPVPACRCTPGCSPACRSEEHTSELQSLMRLSYAVFCLKK